MNFLVTPIAQFSSAHDRRDLLLVGKNGPKFCALRWTEVESHWKVISTRFAKNSGFAEDFASHFPKSPF
jgi:hypothetical protein